MLGIDPLNLDIATGNMRAKVMILQCDVFSARPLFGGVAQFHTALIIFKDGRVRSSCVEGKTSQSS
jgi:hypothetical protein